VHPGDGGLVANTQIAVAAVSHGVESRRGRRLADVAAAVEASASGRWASAARTRAGMTA